MSSEFAVPDEIATLSRASDASGAAATAIEAYAVFKRYGAVTALNGVSLKVETGRTVAIVGPNGAGKTTLVDIMVGVRRADQGAVRVLGRTIAGSQRPDFSRIGAQLQDCGLVRGANVSEYLQLTADLFSLSSTPEELAREFGLQAHLKTKVFDLSVGLRQRLCLALALSHKPELIFLDEPTAGLDPVSRRKIWDILLAFKAGGRTMILTSHYMDEVEHLADEVVVLIGGAIVAQGTPAQLRARSKRASATLDDVYVELTEEYGND